MDIVNRLKKFMDSEDISISQFADTCKIPRPTLSQLLNGRNKKVSDEFIGKIHSAFPNLSVVWLLFGEGDMVATANIQISEPENALSEQNSAYLHPDIQSLPSENLQSKFFTENSSEKLTPSFQEEYTSSQQRFETNSSHHNPSGENYSYTRIPTPSHRLDHTPHKPAEISRSLFDGDEEALAEYHNPNRNNNDTANNPHKAPDIIFTEKQTASAQKPTAEEQNASTTPQISPLDNSDSHTTRSIRINTTPDKRISNIVVFYSDNSFQSFYPEQPV